MVEKFTHTESRGSDIININLGHKVWTASKRELKEQIVDICENYLDGGYTLTLRQLYYQLVSQDAIPNHDKVYKKLSSIKDEIVYSGGVDWSVFEDRGRVPFLPYYENDVKSALEYTAIHYRIDRQRGQNTIVEVWTEKDAISSILKKITSYYGVRISVNKGYTSTTAIKGAYDRFIEAINEGKKIKILYFGDHDPSGLDMIRDINDRLLNMFCTGEQFDTSLFDRMVFDSDSEAEGELFNEWVKVHSKEFPQEKDTGKMTIEELKKYQYLPFFKMFFEVVPVGLTMEQIKQYNPPHNPAKITDPRAKEYIKKFGEVSWEVDALTPRVMESIVKNGIEEFIDMDLFNEVMSQESNERNEIKGLIRNI